MTRAHAAHSRSPDDHACADALDRWFTSARRAFPWRPPIDGPPDAPRDPYHALVSEIMLQQTQAPRVAEAFERFIARFPDARALAEASEDDVRAAWSGLGYYRRARLLHQAAQAIINEHDGAWPDTADELRALPGVGAYTAGAIASCVFGQRTPLVDGNVTRVLARLDAQPGAHASPALTRWAWQRAAELVEHARRPGVLNEALMELGATVCTPRNPTCDRCPLADRCQARVLGRQQEIPAPKAPAKQSVIEVLCARVINTRGRVLVTRRPDTGLWAGMWQPPSVEGPDTPTRRRALREHITARIAGPGAALRPMRNPTPLAHQTTHRRVLFTALTVSASGRAANGARWIAPDQLSELALATPHRRIIEGRLA